MATNVKRKKKAEVMPDDGNMTLTGHLKELRNRLIVCAVVFVAAVVVTLAYADRLIDLLTAMGQGFYTSDNPAEGAVFTYSLAQKADKVTFTIANAAVYQSEYRKMSSPSSLA